MANTLESNILSEKIKIKDNFDRRKEIETTDKIYLKSCQEVMDSYPSSQDDFYVTRRHSVSDFALANGGYQMPNFRAANSKFAGQSWLRSNVFKRVEIMTNEGIFEERVSLNGMMGVCPALTYLVPKQKSAKQNLKYLSENIKTVQTYLDGVEYHTIGLGMYPQSVVSHKLNYILENAFNGGHLKNELQCTGNLYSSFQFSHGDYIQKQNPEFIYKGERYVRTIPDFYNSFDERVYSDGSQVSSGITAQWFKVEPIPFKIDNYDEFISGQNDKLKLESEEILIGQIPFYTEMGDDYDYLWQNSFIRAFLNSANSKDLDGDDKKRAEQQWDFSSGGFLNQAFDESKKPISSYVIPNHEKNVCKDAFSGCVGIKTITIPQSVNKVYLNAFNSLPETKIVFKDPNNTDILFEGYSSVDVKYIYMAKDGTDIILSPYEDSSLDKSYLKYPFDKESLKKILDKKYRQNLITVLTLRQEGKANFTPPDYTLQLFPTVDMKNYFVNKNHLRWKNIVSSIGFDKLDDAVKNYSLTALMKIYYAIGGFSDNQGISEKASDYILKYVAKPRGRGKTAFDIGSEMYHRFKNIIINEPYNPVFADFFMKYYKDNPDFMKFKAFDDLSGSEETVDYLCYAHNSFSNILKNFPNMVVNGNERKSMLTPEFVAKHSVTMEYKDVHDGNEYLALLLGKYNYSQLQFEKMQKILEKAKKINSNLCADKSLEKNGISFRFLEKSDPLGFVLGNITNCCQKIGDVAESCVIDGYLNPDAGFMVFETDVVDDNLNPTGEKMILGEAYVWYDPETKTVCYDNIEVPTNVLNKLKKGIKNSTTISTKDFVKTIKESADAVMMAMNRKGIEVESVTTGQMFNSLAAELEKAFGEPDRAPIAKHRNYDGYSDANQSQFTINIYRAITNRYSESIKSTANKVGNLLNNLRGHNNTKSFNDNHKEM